MRRAIGAAILLLSLTLLIHDAASGRFSIFRRLFTREELTKGLFRALCTADTGEVRILLCRGADVNARMFNGSIIQASSSGAGRKSSAKFGVTLDWKKRRDPPKSLAHKGIDIRSMVGLMLTPLHLAAAQGMDDVAKLIIDKGADLNARNMSGRTPLHAAAGSLFRQRDVWFPHHLGKPAGYKRIAELLIARGAEVSARDRCGDTPLHCALEIHQKEIARLLITNGADLRANDQGYTPLHLSAVAGLADIVEILIARGAALDARTNTGGYTPLHYAGRYNRPGVASILIASGSDVNARTRYDRTPLDLAEQKGNNEIVSLLRQHGGKTGKELDEEAGNQRSEVRDQKPEVKTQGKR